MHAMIELLAEADVLSLLRYPPIHFALDSGLRPVLFTSVVTI